MMQFLVFPVFFIILIIRFKREIILKVHCEEFREVYWQKLKITFLVTFLNCVII